MPIWNLRPWTGATHPRGMPGSASDLSKLLQMSYTFVHGALPLIFSAATKRMSSALPGHKRTKGRTDRTDASAPGSPPRLTSRRCCGPFAPGILAFGVEAEAGVPGAFVGNHGLRRVQLRLSRAAATNPLVVITFEVAGSCHETRARQTHRKAR